MPVNGGLIEGPDLSGVFEEERKSQRATYELQQRQFEEAAIVEAAKNYDSQYQMFLGEIASLCAQSNEMTPFLAFREVLATMPDSEFKMAMEENLDGVEVFATIISFYYLTVDDPGVRPKDKVLKAEGDIFVSAELALNELQAS